jgi:hypothetical protein
MRHASDWDFAAIAELAESVAITETVCSRAA